MLTKNEMACKILDMIDYGVRKFIYDEGNFSKEEMFAVYNFIKEARCRKPYRSSIKNIPVSELKAGLRTANTLERLKIKTLGDLCGMSESDLLYYRNFGKKSLMVLKKELKRFGLRFGLSLKGKPI